MPYGLSQTEGFGNASQSYNSQPLTQPGALGYSGNMSQNRMMSQQDFNDDYNMPDWTNDRLLSQDQFGGSGRRGNNDTNNFFDPGNSQSQGMNFSQPY
jgi:hypothetical protein